jgi:hypothetical protein
MVVLAMIGRQHWQAGRCDFIDLFAAHIRGATTLTISHSIANARQRGPRPVESDDRTIASAAVMQACHLAVARGLKGGLS